MIGIVMLFLTFNMIIFRSNCIKKHFGKFDSSFSMKFGLVFLSRVLKNILESLTHRFL